MQKLSDYFPAQMRHAHMEDKKCSFFILFFGRTDKAAVADMPEDEFILFDPVPVDEMEQLQFVYQLPLLFIPLYCFPFVRIVDLCCDETLED